MTEREEMLLQTLRSVRTMVDRLSTVVDCPGDALEHIHAMVSEAIEQAEEDLPAGAPFGQRARQKD